MKILALLSLLSVSAFGASSALNFPFLGVGGSGIPVYSAAITNSGTPSVASEKGGDWIASITHNNPGDVTLNVNSGFFSSAPNCSCSAKAGFGRVCSPETGNTTTSVRIYTSTGGGTGTNYSFEILCQ